MFKWNGIEKIITTNLKKNIGFVSFWQDHKITYLIAHIPEEFCDIFIRKISFLCYHNSPNQVDLDNFHQSQGIFLSDYFVISHFLLSFLLLFPIFIFPFIHQLFLYEDYVWYVFRILFPHLFRSTGPHF